VTVLTGVYYSLSALQYANVFVVAVSVTSSKKMTKTLVCLSPIIVCSHVCVILFTLITTIVVVFVADILLSCNPHILPVNSDLLHLSVVLDFTH